MNALNWLKLNRRSVMLPSSILLALWLSTARADEPTLAPKKAEDAQKLNLLAQDLEKNKVNVANWLRTTLGFSPELDGFPLDVHVYFDLPDTVKLQAAYAAREKAQADSGVVLLELMTKRLALETLQKKAPMLNAEDRDAGRKLATEIVALFKKLNPDFKLDDSQSQLVKFAFHPAPERPKLPEEDRKRIAVLTQYLEQPRNGGPIATLNKYLGLDADAAHALLWESGTFQLAFERALVQKQMKEPTFLQNVITRANEDALKRKDRTLARTAILWPKPPTKEPGDDELAPLTPARGPKIADAPTPVRTAQQRAEDYRKDIAKAVSLKPAEVRKRADNPTGIFFASEMRVDQSVLKPVSVEYTPGAYAANGKLTITFADDSKRSLAPVHAVDAWMAYEMAYGDSAAKRGDGIELLVLDGPHSYFEVKDGKLITARRREVTIHPALLNRELGLAGMRIDGLPRTRQWLLDEIDADPVWSHFDKEQAAHHRQALHRTADWVFDPWTNLARKYGAHSSVFRVTDVPLLLRGGDGVLVVERDDPAGLWSEPLRRRTFIEADVLIQKYSKLGRLAGEVKRPEGYQAESYKLMADLVPASAELQRLNNFAAVLGVIRWAKNNDATFTAPAKPKDGPRTPEAIAMFPDKVIPLPGHDSKEILKQEVAKLDAELKKLGETEPIKKFQDLCGKVIDANDTQRRRLAQRVDDLMRSSAEVRLFEELVEAKYMEILNIGRKTVPGDSNKPDLEAEKKRLQPLVEKLAALQENSPAEFLFGQVIVTRYLERLKEQTNID